MRTLVTGARGSIGSALCEHLEGEVLPTDIETMDVRDLSRALYTFDQFRPDVVYHLAGLKSAPDGEVDPQAAFEVNALGTSNILKAAKQHDARVILASTCKAADPETVYGASKLLAERMVLHEDGTVARFYNVRETQGNVFDFWRSIPEDEPIPVTNCFRYFISRDEAVQLLLEVYDLPSGRYTLNPGPIWHMSLAANVQYPFREQVAIPRRRGDRMSELRHAASERLIDLGGGLERIESTHDRVPEPVAP